MKKKDERKVVYVRLDAEIIAEINELAESDERSFNSMLTVLLKKGIKNPT